MAKTLARRVVRGAFPSAWWSVALPSRFQSGPLRHSRQGRGGGPAQIADTGNSRQASWLQRARGLRHAAQKTRSPVTAGGSHGARLRQDAVEIDGVGRDRNRPPARHPTRKRGFDILLRPIRTYAPSLRQESPGKEDGCSLKPFGAVQRVQLPPGKGAARRPEASLARVTATPLVKRRQQVPKPGVEPRHHVRAGAFGVLGPGAASTGLQMARSCRSGRGLRAGQRYGRERQET